jgi:hypothetical protein
MSVRMRPFGVWGSFVEVVVGFLMCRPFIRTHEHYPVVFTTVGLLLGGTVFVVGVIGLNHAARIVRRVEGRRR